MKISNLIRSISFLGIMALGFSQSSEAVVYPILNSNENQAASENQTNKMLQHVNSELQEIISEMKATQDQRKSKVENIRKDLEKILKTPAKGKTYCSGKIAWALGQECPE